jgi:LPXTG-motif cell wall-anchored protein
MKTIKKFLSALALVIALCIVPHVNADSEGGYYSLSVKVDGKEEKVASTEVTAEVQKFFDGAVTFNKDGITLDDLNAQKIDIEDVNLHMSDAVPVELIGSNSTDGLFLRDLKLKITGDGDLEFVPLAYSDDGYTTITDIEKQKEFVKDYIVTDLEVSYHDGHVYINRQYGTTSDDEDDANTLADGDVTFKSEQEINSSYTLKADNIYSKLSSTELSNYNSKLNGKKLIGLFDISVMDGTNKVDVNSGKYTIRIAMSDDMKNYSKYSVVYIKDGAIVDTLAAKAVNNKYIEFETTHLSQYGVVGEVSNSVDSPNTGVTSIVLYIIMGLSSLALIGLVVKKRIDL